jgi:WD40 repeat protein
VLAVTCSLVGHRSNCLTIDVFPHTPGNVVATGSLDTNVKVWDVRRKEAIRTFKGHTRGIRKIAVSPDAKWICSGSENGEIKVGSIQSAACCSGMSSRMNSTSLVIPHVSSMAGGR